MSEAPRAGGTEPGCRHNMATRQLCAGVYLDRTLREDVVRRVLLDPRHRVAKSYGFDLRPVVDHAIRALVLDLSVRFCLGAVLVICWSTDPLLFLAVCGVLVFLETGKHAVRRAPKVALLRIRELLTVYLRRIRFLRETKERQEADRALTLIMGVCAASLIALVIVAGHRHWSATDAARSLAVPLFLIAGVSFLGAACHRYSANAAFHGKGKEPSRMGRRTGRIARQQWSDYVVYRRPPPMPEDGTEGPLDKLVPRVELPPYFVGAGELVHRWLPPLTVPLLKAEGGAESVASAYPDKQRHKPEFEVPPFHVADLVNELKEALQEVGDWFEPGSLPQLEVRDRVFVEESVLSKDRGLLREDLTSERLRRILDDPFGALHHYLEISTTATGEVVTTVFLRVTVKARSLILDFATCALTRLPAGYATPGMYGEGGWWSAVREGALAVWDLPREVLAVVRLAVLPRLAADWLWTRFDWTVRRRRGSAIGTVYSVREDRATPWREADHDQPEIRGHIKIIEQRLLRTVERFLAEHGIDTADFEKKAQTVISANVLNMGGRMDITNSAVGPNAHAVRVSVDQIEGND